MFRKQTLTLQIEPTRQCNLNCGICMRANLSDRDTVLCLDDFRAILSTVNCRHVGLHGWGEPLLNPWLFEMVEYAESRGVRTNLTTNGTLIGGKVDEIIGSGLREIAIGVYQYERLMAILPKIKQLIDRREDKGLKRPKVYLDITIYKENLDRLADFLWPAAESRVDAVILHRLFNIHNVDPAARYISAGEETALLGTLKKRAKGLRLRLYLPPEHSLPCRIVKQSIFVTARGDVTPCCLLPEFHLGNALDRGVKQIMRAAQYADFRKTMAEHPICSKCISW